MILPFSILKRPVFESANDVLVIRSNKPRAVIHLIASLPRVTHRTTLAYPWLFARQPRICVSRSAAPFPESIRYHSRRLHAAKEAARGQLSIYSNQSRRWAGRASPSDVCLEANACEVDKQQAAALRLLDWFKFVDSDHCQQCGKKQ
jgi:hypothetical protein